MSRLVSDKTFSLVCFILNFTRNNALIRLDKIVNFTGIQKCRTNGGSIRKINCRRRRKQTKYYEDRQMNDIDAMTCCCHVECDPIQKPAKQLFDEYSNVR